MSPLHCLKGTLLIAFAWLFTGSVFAGPGPQPSHWSRVIVDIESGEVLVQEGDWTAEPLPPCSTFKIPLALIGFDAGILQTLEEPAWPYDPAYRSNREEEKRTTQPIGWMHASVVWYSQELVRKLGRPAFEKQIHAMNYGNGNLSGPADDPKGWTRSWLSSTLLISPREQVAFLRRMLRGELPVSQDAVEMTKAVMPQFVAGSDWTVHGKTGTGFQKKKDGTLNRQRQIGWFVGWAEKGKGERRVVFAEFIADSDAMKTYAGPRCRDRFLQALPDAIRPPEEK